jgi:hypothetical protein
MNVTKRILCLAFSRKIGGHCVAGVDVLSGKWIRPVSRAAHGTLTYNQCLILSETGVYREPRLLDVLELDLAEPAPKIAQPENWIVTDAIWKVSAGVTNTVEFLESIAVSDPEIFRGHARSVTSSELELRPPSCSLMLIEPESLFWTASKDRYGRRRMDGTFSISGSTYKLPLTDDVYESRLAQVRENQTVPHQEISLNRVFLTISLGDFFEETGRHYKLIAGVVEICQ